MLPKIKFKDVKLKFKGVSYADKYEFLKIRFTLKTYSLTLQKSEERV